jgi:hypothetical protein
MITSVCKEHEHFRKHENKVLCFKMHAGKAFPRHWFSQGGNNAFTTTNASIKLMTVKVKIPYLYCSTGS